MNKKLKWKIIYSVIFLYLLVQAFSQSFTDEFVYTRVGYFMSKGLIPYIDFFEHHALFYYVFYVPIFILFRPHVVQIALRIISVLFSMISAYLFFNIVKKNKIKSPHYATLLFLLGYTGLPISFLRNEFFAMLCLLLYFYFDNTLLKSISLALFGSSSIMFAMTGVLLFIYNLYLAYKQKKSTYI